MTTDPVTAVVDLLQLVGLLVVTLHSVFLSVRHRELEERVRRMDRLRTEFGVAVYEALVELSKREDGHDDAN